MKGAGRVRSIGVTTSHGRRHDELKRMMAREPLDFLQFTYNLADREAVQQFCLTDDDGFQDVAQFQERGMMLHGSGLVARMTPR